MVEIFVGCMANKEIELKISEVCLLWSPSVLLKARIFAEREETNVKETGFDDPYPRIWTKRIRGSFSGDECDETQRASCVENPEGVQGEAAAKVPKNAAFEIFIRNDVLT